MQSMKGAVLAAVSAISFTAAAHAQDAGSAPQAQAADSSAASDIVVTARRRDESIQAVPLVVNAVTAEEIQKLNFRDFSEVQSLVPGLQFFSNANGIAAGAQLRGIQYDPNSGVAPSVAFYQNDAPIEGSLVLQTMYDIGQVEVLRGPQGTLRGSATPSGSIVVTTRRPDLDRVGGYITATGNDIGTENINGGFSVPIVKGIAAIRFAGAYNTSEGNRVRTIQTDGDARKPFSETKSGRISLLVEPADFLKLSAVYQTMNHTTREFDQYASFSLFNPTAPASPRLITPQDRLSIESNPRTINQTFNSYNVRAEIRAAGQLLIYQGQKYDLNVYALTNSDAANLLSGKNFFQNTHTYSEAWTHEIRLQNEARVAGMFDYVLGYVHGLNKPNTNLTTQTPVFLPAAFGGGLATVASTPISIPNGHITDESFFGNLTAHLGDSTELSGGARHLKHRDPGVPLIIAGRALPGTPVNDDGMIYIASLKHQFTRDVMAYASFGTSRRPGSFAIGDFSVVKSALQTSFQNLQTEKSRSFEVGIKSTLLGGKARANLTAYHQTFTNYPFRSQSPIYYVNYAATVGAGGAVTVTPGVGSFNFVASVPVTVNGAEGEFDLDVTPSWQIGATASYSLGKIRNGLVPCNDLNADGVPDNLTAPPTLAVLQAAVGANNIAGCQVTQRASFQPPFSATVQSEYHRRVSAHVDGFARGLLTFNGESQGDPQFAYDQVGAYGLLNLYLGIRDAHGGWEVSLYGKNVGGVTKATTVGPQAATSYQQLVLPTFTTVGKTFTSTYSQISTTPVREFGVTARFAFGSR